MDGDRTERQGRREAPTEFIDHALESPSGRNGEREGDHIPWPIDELGSSRANFTADTPAEVDAAFRTIRRVGVGYFVTFLIGVGGMPILTLGLNWWTGGRLFGGMSPAFVMAACGLYVFFFVIGLVAAKLADGVEARMLGGQDDETDEWSLRSDP